MTHTFGIFGTGLMAEIYATLLTERPDCKVVAAVGNSPEGSIAFADKFDIPTYSGSKYEDLLQHHDVQSLIIATPEWVRKTPLELAAKTSKNLLLEKPFAANWEEAKLFAGLLDNHPAHIAMCHVLRYSPRFCALKATISGGQIGEVRHIHAKRHSNNKRVLRVLGKADLAFWLTPHDIDMVRWVTGAEVAQVFATSRNGLTTADDYLVAHLKLTNGVDAVIEISWCGPPTSGTARNAYFEVRGTQGHVELDDFDMNVRVFGEEEKVSAPDTYEDYLVHGLRNGFFKNMVDNFIQRLSTPVSNRAEVQSGIESIRVCSMIRSSLDEKRLVSREEIT